MNIFIEQDRIERDPKEGDLMVWWIPQVPMDVSFRVPVRSVEEGVLLMNVLANYDLFQFYNNIKPDFSNAGGLLIFEDGEWLSWECDGYDDPEEYLRVEIYDE